VLLGDANSKLSRSLFLRFGWGRMVVDRSPRPLPEEPWALDNGAYRDFKAGRPADWSRFLLRLDRIEKRVGENRLTRPLFVVTPDLIGAGGRGLAYQVSWAERLRKRFPATCRSMFLVVEKGYEPRLVRRERERFAGLFFAGTDRFKQQEGERWRDVAAELGWWFHYARCSTPAHLARAFFLSAASVDSARPLSRSEYLAAYVETFRALAGREAV
jgi:hypothetical protein